MSHAYVQRASFKKAVASVVSLALAFALMPIASLAHAAEADLDFGATEVGYGDAQWGTITVQNPNSREMNLTLASLQGEFELDGTLPTVMAANSTYAVKVRPKSNLPVGTYKGSVAFQLKGTLGTVNMPAMSLSFTVTEEKQAPAPATKLDFGTAKVGYAKPEARTVTVYNPTDQTVEFTLKSIADGFEVVSGLPQQVAPWSNVDIKVAPKAGLSAGTYEGSAVIQSKTKSGARATTSVGLKFVVDGASADPVEVPTSKYSRYMTFFGQVNLPDGSVKYYKDAKDGYTVTYTNEAQVEQIQELTEVDKKALAEEESAYKKWFMDYGMSEEDFEAQVKETGTSSLRQINQNPFRTQIGASFAKTLTYDVSASEAAAPKFIHQFHLFGSITEVDGSVKYYKDAKDGVDITYTNNDDSYWNDKDLAAYTAEQEAFKKWFLDNGVSEDDFKRLAQMMSSSRVDLSGNVTQNSRLTAEYEASQAPRNTFNHTFSIFGKITDAQGNVKYYKDAKDGITLEYTNQEGSNWTDKDSAAYKAEQEAFKKWFLDNGVSEDEFKNIARMMSSSRVDLSGNVTQNSRLTAEYEAPITSKFSHIMLLKGTIIDPQGNVKYYKDAKDGVKFEYSNEADVEQVGMKPEDEAARKAEIQAFKQWFLDNGMTEEEYKAQVQESAKSALTMISQNPTRTMIGSYSESILEYKQQPKVDNKPNLEERPIAVAFKNFWQKVTSFFSKLFRF